MIPDTSKYAVRTRCLVFATLCLGGAAASAAAQGMTWVVDEAGGPGSQFTDIPPAVQAASDGDTVIVRAGTYSSFTTGKALAVLGTPGSSGVTIDTGPGFPGPSAIEVTGLAAGKTFVAANLNVTVQFWATSGIALRDNSGRVHLENVSSTEQPMATGPSGPALDIANCSQVTVIGGLFRGAHGIRAADSTVSVCGAMVRGRHASINLAIFCRRAFPGLELTNSMAYLSRCDVQGGDGFTLTYTNCPPEPAVTVDGGTATISGDRATTMTAGNFLFGPAWFTPAVAVLNGTAEIDSRVRLSAPAGGPVTAGAVTLRRIVSLTAAGATAGGTATAEVVSPAGDTGLVLLSLPADPVATPFGQLFVNLAAFATIGGYVQTAVERASFTVPIPPSGGLRGAALAVQAANLGQSSGLIELSNPAVFVVQ